MKRLLALGLMLAAAVAVAGCSIDATAPTNKTSVGIRLNGHFCINRNPGYYYFQQSKYPSLLTTTPSFADSRVGIISQDQNGQFLSWDANPFRANQCGTTGVTINWNRVPRGTHMYYNACGYEFAYYEPRNPGYTGPYGMCSPSLADFTSPGSNTSSEPGDDPAPPATSP